MGERAGFNWHVVVVGSGVVAFVLRSELDGRRILRGERRWSVGCIFQIARLHQTIV